MESLKWRRFELIWLVFLLVPIVVLAHMPLLKAVSGYTLLALFLACYLWSPRSEGLKRLKIAVLLLIIVIISTYIDASHLYMLFFVIPHMGQRSTRREVIAWIGALALAIGATILLQPQHPTPSDLLANLPILLVMVILPFLIHTQRRETQLKEELNAANARNASLLLQEERHRIAKDLHDTLGHTLSLIALKSELAEHLVKLDPERAQAEIRVVRETARRALREARETVSQMRTVTLPAELAAAEELLRTAGIALTTAVEPVTLAPLVENMLGFCLREAVTNVVRHSQAKSCAIGLKVEHGMTILTVQDDGVGIQRPGNGTGMHSMRDRLELVDGTLTVSEPPGTLLTLQVPNVVRGGATHG